MSLRDLLDPGELIQDNLGLGERYGSIASLAAVEYNDAVWHERRA
jgi:hypothetical protein